MSEGLEILSDGVRTVAHLPHCGTMTYSFMLLHKHGRNNQDAEGALIKSATFNTDVYACGISPDGRYLAVALQDGLVYILHRHWKNGVFNSVDGVVSTGYFFPSAVVISDGGGMIALWHDKNLHVWKKGGDNLWRKEVVTGDRLFGSDTNMSDGYWYFEHRDHGEIAVVNGCNEECYRWKRRRFLWWHYWRRLKVWDRKKA